MYFLQTIGSSGFYYSVGAVPHNYLEEHQPGWERHTIWYHADDGKLYRGRCSGRDFRQKCTVGDKIACSVAFAALGNTVTFRRNGNKFGGEQRILNFEKTLPAVGLHSPGGVVKVML